MLPIMGQPHYLNSNILRNLNKMDLEFPGDKSSSFKVFRACEICQKKQTKKKQTKLSSLPY